jgi:iron complex transport system substrate-binding protein
VCAPSGNEVSQVLKALPSKPEILWMTPKNIAEIFQNVRDLGRTAGCAQVAEKLISESQAKLDQIATVAGELSDRPRVFCLEWIDPIYCSGHWVPEMVAIAGGKDELGKKGADSIRISWDEVREWAPEILIIMPCGFNLEKVAEQAPQITRYDGWRDLPAVRNNRVYAVDANSYFARPGPRVVEGTELLAHLIHPQAFAWHGASDAFKHVEFSVQIANCSRSSVASVP